jgi:hypothetical protein
MVAESPARGGVNSMTVSPEPAVIYGENQTLSVRSALVYLQMPTWILSRLLLRLLLSAKRPVLLA